MVDPGREEGTDTVTSFSPLSLLSVLDLNAFERQNKAEGLGMVNEDGTGEALSWASLSLGHHLPSGCTSPIPLPLPRAPFLQDTSFPGAPSSASLWPQPCPSPFLQGLPPHDPPPQGSSALCSLAHHHTDPALHVPKSHTLVAVLSLMSLIWANGVSSLLCFDVSNLSILILTPASPPLPALSLSPLFFLSLCFALISPCLLC